MTWSPHPKSSWTYWTHHQIDRLMNLRSNNKVDPRFNMSSMTDLVFLLLIFFIILSTLVSPYSLPVNLPKGSAKGQANEKVAVRIGEDLTYSVNNKIIQRDQLESELSSALGVFDKDNKKVLLRADTSVPTGNTVEVFDICYRNKWTVVIATKP